MPGKQLKVEAVIEALATGDDRVKDAAVWIAARHPEWGSAIASFLKNDLAGRMRLSDERLRRQLVGLASSPEIQALIATHAAAGSRTALAAIAEARLKQIPESWAHAVGECLKNHRDPDAAIAAARALSANKEVAAMLAGDLLQVAAQPNLPPATRLAAVAALPTNTTTIHTHLFNFLVAQLSPSEPLTSRLLAADALNRAKLSPEQLKLLLGSVQSAGPLELERLLPAFDRTSDAQIGAALITTLKDAKSLRSLTPDSIRRRFVRHSDDVKKQAEDLITTLNPDATKQRAHLEQMLKTLPPGDLRRGQVLFNSDKAACSTCHAIGYVGGTVGPDLTKIGATRSDRDLLESIIFPSASFTQSYTTTIVDTTDNDRQSGILKKDDADEVILLIGPNQELRIPRSKIKSMRPDAISIMPAGLDQQISQQDLADLLAFLKACK
jgi:putative heme-binding domain-containing protein